MIVTARAMKEYRDALSKISGKAAEDMQNYIMAHGYNINDDFLDYAYALATKYGEASSALACEFYDELSSYWARPEVAEPAKTATYGEVAKTVNGTALYSFDLIPQSVGRLVKMSAEDTVLHNAIRDGAYFAWIPSGDTCPFCIMLASNGWQKASGKALKNGHAEHIHANCDCTYAIRFDDSMDYEGYDPDEYFDKYNNASDSYDWKDKLNAMRRENYASKKDLINAQKREAYAKRKATTLHNKTVTESELKSVSRNWYDGLSLREQGLAVSFDTYNFTRDANRLNDTKELAQAISKYNLPGNITTYRGVSQEEFTDMIFNYGSKGLKTGEIKGTSIDLGRAEAFASTRGGYVFEYHINPGNNGAYFDGGVPGSNEQQFVLNKDVKYEVESVDQKNKRIILNVG